MSIFKACDIRGRFGSSVTEETALSLGRAVGSEIRGQQVVVGGDLRPGTGSLQKNVIRGLLASGANVLDIGIVPTPAYYFAKSLLGAPGGVMVTGSHNPPGDNGFKVSLGATAVTPEDIAGLRQRIQRGEFTSGRGKYQKKVVLSDYGEFLSNRFGKGEKLKIVVDAGNGCYSTVAPMVLSRCGFVVEPLYCKPDGTFPNRSPNPAVAQNLKAMRDAVLRTGADAGAAYDGDGDRVVFCDERGRLLEGDIAAVLFSRHLLSRAACGRVVYDIKSSGVLAEEVRVAGGEPLMEKSGHAFIRNTLLKENAVFAGEISGHFFFGELGYDDGLFATLMMLDIIRKSGGSLAALSNSVTRYPATPDIRLPCSPDKARKIIKTLRKAYLGKPGVSINNLDGVRIGWPDGWALARLSVTEPLITLRFEAHTAARLTAIRDEVASHIPEIQNFPD